MRARHEVSPLVAGLVFPLDPGEPPDGRGRDQEHLAPVREGQRPGFGQRHRIAFLGGRGRIGVDLVEEDVPRRGGPQPDRRVRAGHDQDAACELLRQHGVARIAGSRGLHPLPQLGTLLDQRIDPLPRVPLGQFHRRLDRQHRPRRVVHHVPNEAVAPFCRAHLSCLHEHDTLHRIAGAQLIHDLAHVGRARGAVLPRLGRGARGEPPMPVRPARDGQVRIGADPAAPRPKKSLCPVEGERLLIRALAGPRRGCRAGHGHGPPEPSASAPPPPRTHPPAPR
jgi:hypothetical protein